RRGAAGRTVAQWTVSPQRLGSDLARSLGDADTKAGYLRTRPRHRGRAQRRLRRPLLRSATAAGGRLLPRYPPRRQQQRWPHLWHYAVGDRERRPVGLPAHALTHGEFHDRCLDDRLDTGAGGRAAYRLPPTAWL